MLCLGLDARYIDASIGHRAVNIDNDRTASGRRRNGGQASELEAWHRLARRSGDMAFW